jgi:hypothetical protein
MHMTDFNYSFLGYKASTAARLLCCAQESVALL